MNGTEIIEALNEYGAIKECYEIAESSLININNKYYQASTIIMTIDCFVSEYINNVKVKNMLYVFNIEEASPYLPISDPLRGIRFTEVDVICEYKSMIKKIKKLKNIINGD